MAWTIEVKSSAYPTWIPADSVTSRNVIGAGVIEKTVQSGDATAFPGVLRYHVNEVQGTPPTTIVGTRRAIFQGDIYNPDIADAAWYIVDPIKLTVQVGNEYDIGTGYAWNTNTKQWCPVRSFGLIIPGEIGTIMSVRFTSTFTVPQVFCSVGWGNSGPTNFFSAQVAGSGWKAASQSPLLLFDDANVYGLISPGNSCIVDFRPEPSDLLDNTHNPITLSIGISSSSI